MIVEAVLLLAIITASFILILDACLYPRHKRLFMGKPALVKFSKSLLPIVAIIFCVRSFTFEAFRIPSGSMQPTLLAGDLVVVDKFSHGLRVPLLGYRITASKPRRGDVVVFRGQVNGKNSGLIKRIVALPGDKVEYKNSILYVNNSPSNQYKTYFTANKLEPEYKFTDLVVPEHSYFVIGDHRNNSYDSRSWGVLDDQKLIGKARLIAFSFDWDSKSVRWGRIGRVS